MTGWRFYPLAVQFAGILVNPDGEITPAAFHTVDEVRTKARRERTKRFLEGPSR